MSEAEPPADGRETDEHGLGQGIIHKLHHLLKHHLSKFSSKNEGYYHMDVAVKLLNMDHVEMEEQLETFREEVRSLMSTRHENIVFCIGCCLVPPYLGIVMPYCKGPTLHDIIHDRTKWTQLPLSTSISAAIQICQGMSYLHCKKILHKDLRSKNIFFQSRNKVVISDFGIFSCRRLFTNQEYISGCSRIHVPQYWLQYQSPEIIRTLNAPSQTVHQVQELSFSHSSDVFAFGSIWYELMTWEFPHSDLPHQVMWRIGNGSTPPLNHRNLTSDDTDILSSCWDFDASMRPRFADLSRSFQKMVTKARLRTGRSLPMTP